MNGTTEEEEWRHAMANHDWEGAWNIQQHAAAAAAAGEEHGGGAGAGSTAGGASQGAASGGDRVVIRTINAANTNTEVNDAEDAQAFTFPARPPTEVPLLESQAVFHIATTSAEADASTSITGSASTQASQAAADPNTNTPSPAKKKWGFLKSMKAVFTGANTSGKDYHKLLGCEGIPLLSGLLDANEYLRALKTEARLRWRGMAESTDPNFVPVASQQIPFSIFFHISDSVPTFYAAGLDTSIYQLLDLSAEHGFELIRKGLETSKLYLQNYRNTAIPLIKVSSNNGNGYSRSIVVHERGFEILGGRKKASIEWNQVEEIYAKPMGSSRDPMSMNGEENNEGGGATDSVTIAQIERRSEATELLRKIMLNFSNDEELDNHPGNVWDESETARLRVGNMANRREGLMSKSYSDMAEKCLLIKIRDPKESNNKKSSGKKPGSLGNPSTIPGSGSPQKESKDTDPDAGDTHFFVFHSLEDCETVATLLVSCWKLRHMPHLTPTAIGGHKWLEETLVIGGQHSSARSRRSNPDLTEEQLHQLQQQTETLHRSSIFAEFPDTEVRLTGSRTVALSYSFLPKVVTEEEGEPIQSYQLGGQAGYHRGNQRGQSGGSPNQRGFSPPGRGSGGGSPGGNAGGNAKHRVTKREDQADGTVYFGEFNAKNEKSGRGVLYFDVGQSTGWWRNGFREGPGEDSLYDGEEGI